ncbi:MAG TPA: Gfo/Idh/MocA family oxidoreductase [Crenalkalicoccus sp.]|jgi:predicted dehydrogenase|nr:Gfo/Idh/MocA family oxidoreductase [Crenalkalicoccus sp.]
MPARRIKGPKVRYGVVGAGWISQAALMPAAAHTGNSELTALVTGDPAKARALGERYGIRHLFKYDELQRLIDSDIVDALYVATPNWLHRQHSVPALEAGLAVLLEKPMATTVEDCEAIIAASRRSGAALMIAYRLHFEPATLEAIRLVQSRELGDPRIFSSAFSQHVAPTNHRAQHGYWAGPVTDMGPYPINAVRNLFAAEPVEAHAVGIRTPGLGFNFEDTVSVVLRFPEERIAQFTVSYAAESVDQYRVIGTRGDLEVAPGFTFGHGLRHRLTLGGRTQEREFPETDQFGGELKYFSDCLLQGREPEPDGEEGLADVRVLAALEQVLLTGRPQRIEAPPRRRRPSPDQAITLPPVEPPELVHAAEPGKG